MPCPIAKKKVPWYSSTKWDVPIAITGPALNAMEFYALGVSDIYQRTDEHFNTSSSDPRVLGRASFTQREEDRYKFKVPQLYNLANAHFYFHGSS